MARIHFQRSKAGWGWMISGGLSLLCFVLWGQQTNTNVASTNTPASETIDPFDRAMMPADPSSPIVKSNMPIREVGPGLYEMGDVRIDQAQRTVSFPARLNLDSGPMEYFLVTSWGKTHESILKTDTEPFRIHLAMLLIDPKAGGTNGGTNGPPVHPGGFVSNPSPMRLPGLPVSIELDWNANGKETHRSAADLVFNTNQQSVLRTGDWVYTGSRIADGLFLAEIDGSIVSLVTDAEALINSEAVGHDNDTIWFPNTNNLPPTNIPVRISIKLKP